jgi:hypothetical protein
VAECPVGQAVCLCSWHRLHVTCNIGAFTGRVLQGVGTRVGVHAPAVCPLSEGVEGVEIAAEEAVGALMTAWASVLAPIQAPVAVVVGPYPCPPLSILAKLALGRKFDTIALFPFDYWLPPSRGADTFPPLPHLLCVRPPAAAWSLLKEISGCAIREFLRRPGTVLVQTVSLDLEMGKGFAKDLLAHSVVKPTPTIHTEIGSVLMQLVLNRWLAHLISKACYWHKPSVDDLEIALRCLRSHLHLLGLSMVVMPCIAAGLDKIPWPVTRQLIVQELCAHGIDVTVVWLSGTHTPIAALESPIRPCPDPSCAVCRVHDSLYEAHRASSGVDLRGLAVQLAEDKDRFWWHQQDPMLWPVEVDSVARCGPLSRQESRWASFARWTLAAIARRPPLAPGRCPLPLSNPSVDGLIDYKWESDERPDEELTISRPSAKAAPLLKKHLLTAVAKGFMRFCRRCDILTAALVFMIFSPKDRMCVAMFAVNWLLSNPRVVYESLDKSLRGVILWLYKGDEADAFNHLRLSAVAMSHSGVVVVWPDGTVWYLQFIVYWFGVSQGPQAFTEASERTVVHLRPLAEDPAYLLRYMDDSTGGEVEWLGAVVAALGLVMTVTWDGWRSSPRKVFWLPHALLKALGLVVDPIVNRLRVAQSSAATTSAIVGEVLEILRNPDDQRNLGVSALLRTVGGKLAFYVRAVPTISSLRMELNQSMGGTLTEGLEEELVGLHAILPSLPLMLAPGPPTPPVLVILSDAHLNKKSKEGTGMLLRVIVDENGRVSSKMKAVNLRELVGDICLTSSAGAEMSVVIVGVEDANADDEYFNSVVHYGDAQAVVNCLRRMKSKSVSMAKLTIRLHTALYDIRCGVLRPVGGNWMRRNGPVAMLTDSGSDAPALVVRHDLALKVTVICIAGALDVDMSASTEESALAPISAIPTCATDRGALFAKWLEAARYVGTIAPLLPSHVSWAGRRIVITLQPAFESWLPLLTRANISRATSVIVLHHPGMWASVVAALDAPVAACLLTPPSIVKRAPWVCLAWGRPPQGPCDHSQRRLRWTVTMREGDLKWFRNCPCVPGGGRYGSKRLGTEAQVAYYRGGHQRNDHPTMQNLAPQHVVHPPAVAGAANNEPRGGGFGSPAEDDLARTGHPPGDGPVDATPLSADRILTHEAIWWSPSGLPRRGTGTGLPRTPPLVFPGIPSPPQWTAEASPSPSASWQHMMCRGCLRGIEPVCRARFCDAEECGETWPVCGTCAPPKTDLSTMFCPKHQLRRTKKVGAAAAPLEALQGTRAGSLGRLVARLWAKAMSVPPEILKEYGASEEGADIDRLSEMAAKVAASAWGVPKRKALEGPARRLFEYLDLEDFLTLPSSRMEEAFLLYADARLSGPMQGWEDCVPRTVMSEMSRVCTAMREDGLVIGPAGGAACRGYLISRGARERPGHSNKYPVTPHMLVQWERTCVTTRERQIWGAAIVQSFFALRAGATARVRREDLRKTCDGWLLEWRQPHKTRRGDPLRPAAVLPAQSSAARGIALEKALSLAATSGPLFPTVSANDITLWLRERVSDPPTGFSVSAHGIRAGTDVALQALGVPEDVIAQWGWWSRIRRMTGYYGATAIAICLVASELMTRVNIVNTSVGWYDVLGEMPAVPDWNRLRSFSHWEAASAQAVAAMPLAPSDDDDSDEDMPGRRPSPAVLQKLRYGGARARVRREGAAALPPVVAKRQRKVA